MIECFSMRTLNRYDNDQSIQTLLSINDVMGPIICKFFREDIEMISFVCS